MPITKLDKTKYTLAELLELAEDKGLSQIPNAKNPLSPTKQEVVDALFDFELSGIDPIEALQIREDNKQAVEEKKPELTDDERFNLLSEPAKRRVLKDIYVYSRPRVIITKNPKSIKQEKVQDSLADDTQGVAIEYKTWGNDFIGHYRTRIIFDKPWHIPYGLLVSLQASETYNLVKKGDTNVYTTEVDKKYNISMLDPLSMEEIKNISRNQSMLKAQNTMNNY